MANVLKPEKQEQIRALGRLGWSLRRIEKATGHVGVTDTRDTRLHDGETPEATR